MDDKDACTIDACDPTTGKITHAPAILDDGDACTADSCDAALGVQHTPLNMDDGDACTTDWCDPAQGVQHTPVAPSVACGACPPNWYASEITKGGCPSGDQYRCELPCSAVLHLCEACPPGYHMTATQASPACGGGASFTCEKHSAAFNTCFECPTGWHKTAQHCDAKCMPCQGTGTDVGVRCEENSKPWFSQCSDLPCPDGWTLTKWSHLDSCPNVPENAVVCSAP